MSKKRKNKSLLRGELIEIKNPGPEIIGRPLYEALQKSPPTGKKIARVVSINRKTKTITVVSEEE